MERPVLRSGQDWGEWMVNSLWPYVHELEAENAHLWYKVKICKTWIKNNIQAPHVGMDQEVRHELEAERDELKKLLQHIVDWRNKELPDVDFPWQEAAKLLGRK